MTSLFRNRWLRSLGAGLAGFVVYGGWAYFANSGHGQAAAMMAGLLQGSYSLLLTFFTTLLMEQLYRWFAPLRFRVAATIAVTGVLLFSIPCVIHALASTPEILMTILPGFAIGMVYTTVYVLGLERLAGSADSPRA